MSNPAVITLANASSRKGKFKRFVIEDNIGESMHLHIDNMRVDFTIKEFLEFSQMIRESLTELNLLGKYVLGCHILGNVWAYSEIHCTAACSLLNSKPLSLLAWLR